METFIFKCQYTKFPGNLNGKITIFAPRSNEGLTHAGQYQHSQAWYRIAALGRVFGTPRTSLLGKTAFGQAAILPAVSAKCQPLLFKSALSHKNNKKGRSSHLSREVGFRA